MSSLCLTLAERSRTSLREKISQYCDQVDFIEVRLDYLDEIEVPTLPTGVKAKFIATCRPPREGGLFRGSEVERLAVLKSAVEIGFDWIDLEWDVAPADFEVSQAQIVRSRHLFGSFPPELGLILDELRKQAGAAYKVAVSVSTTADLVRLLSWAETLPEELPRVVLGMGALGQVSRALGPFLKNLWTYVIENEGDEVAPGQFSLKTAKQVLQVDRWDDLTSLYILVSTRRPSLQQVRILNGLFEHYGQNSVAVPWFADDPGALEEYVARSGLPFKGIGFCGDSSESGADADSAKNRRQERMGKLFRQWTSIDPDPAVIQGFISED